MTEFIWDEDIKTENKSIIEKHLNDWRWLVPTWCQSIKISLTCANADFTARILTRYEYRNAYLDIATDWLNQTDEKKVSDLVHEFCHNFYNPLYLYAHDQFDILLPEDESPKYRKSVFGSLETFNELGTSDLAFALINKFNADDNAK